MVVLALEIAVAPRRGRNEQVHTGKDAKENHESGPERRWRSRQGWCTSTESTSAPSSSHAGIGRGRPRHGRGKLTPSPHQHHRPHRFPREGKRGRPVRTHTKSSNSPQPETATALVCAALTTSLFMVTVVGLFSHYFVLHGRAHGRVSGSQDAPPTV